MPFALRFLFLLSVFLGVSVDAKGQVAPGTIREVPMVPVGESPAVVPLQRAPLDSIILIDEATGKPVRVLPGRWSLEDLDDLLVRQQQDAAPPFIIKQLAARGHIVDNRAEAVLHFVFTTSGDQPIRIPLGLKEGIFPFSSSNDASGELPLPYQYAGPGVFDLIVDPQDGQYVALIRNQERGKPLSNVPTIGEEPSEQTANLGAETEQGRRRPQEVAVEQRHELTLSLWFPLTGIGEEGRRLSISFPQAVISQFQLSVPMAGATATVAQGSLLDTFFPEDGQTTLFSVRGFKSNFDISWHRGKSDRLEDRSVLSLQDAAIIARLENQSTLYDAVLPISSSMPFDRALIRLPQDAVLDREFASDGEYTFRELTPEEKSAIRASAEAHPDAAVYEVQFSRKAASQTVRLRAVQPISADKVGEFRDIGGFEVIGAERQTGSLSVGIPGEMRPNWKPIRGLRRVDLSNLPVQEGIDARFDFMMQPFLLRAQIVLPQTRINVRPEYQVQVNKGRLVLTARFSYVVLGSKTDKLQLALPDWLWIDIGPTSIVDLDGVSKDSDLLNIPLRSPLDGTFEIELKAIQSISPEENAAQRVVVRLPTPALPSPDASWIEPASVVIVPDDNVELHPVDTEAVTEPETMRTVGLARKGRRTVPIRIDIPQRQQDALIYQTESANPVLVADVQYHRQTISVALQSNVRIFEPENQVTANLVYSVAHEPIDRLVLFVPKAVDEIGQWSVVYDDKDLEIRDVPITVDDGVAPDQWVKRRISLPEAMIGKIPLTVRYSIPPISAERNIRAAAYQVPLVRPVEANVSGHSVYLSAPGGFRIEPHGDDDGVWKPIDVPYSGSTGLRSPLRTVGFVSPQLQDKIPLLISLEERESQGTTVVEKAWIQTWLTDRVRVDRAVYQLTSDHEFIALRLPSSVGRGIRILLDGETVAARPTDEGALVVPLTPGQQFRPLVLDVWYQLSETPLHGLVRMDLPHFDQNTVVRCAYWQLILPSYRHLVGLPTDWAPEYEWRWNGLFWGRTPSFRMESVGFSDDLGPPTDAVQYLFSSLHPPTSVSFYVFNRSWIVLGASGLSLFVGLALIYFPRCRYAGALFGLGIALFATIQYQPAPVLLALQAASLGVFLALGASYAYRILNRSDRWNITPLRHARMPSDDGYRSSEVYSVIIDESGSKKEESQAKT